MECMIIVTEFEANREHRSDSKVLHRKSEEGKEGRKESKENHHR